MFLILVYDLSFSFSLVECLKVDDDWLCLILYSVIVLTLFVLIHFVGVCMISMIF